MTATALGWFTPPRHFHDLWKNFHRLYSPPDFSLLFFQHTIHFPFFKYVLCSCFSSFGILIKEFFEHKADLTTIEINRDFLTLYFTGSDSLVCSVQYQEGEWNLTSKFRGQSHDISKICLLK